MAEKSIILFQGDGEWSALYVDGKLDRVGDHYLCDERIRELCGIEVEYGDDFLLGGSTRLGAARTIADLRAWQARRDQIEEEAVHLEEKAAELRQRAATLRRSKPDG